ncbi:hypothetical protein KM043_015659 [Ampulex compressa]|nr:hypothetical protein KM043_015659 [Ampulex compressa]
MVIVREDNLPPLQWLLGRVKKTVPGADDEVLAATIRTSRGAISRPTVKLCPLTLSINLVMVSNESFEDYLHDKTILANKSPVDNEEEVVEYILGRIRERNFHNLRRMLWVKTKSDLIAYLLHMEPNRPIVKNRKESTYSQRQGVKPSRFAEPMSGNQEEEAGNIKRLRTL